MYTYTHTRNTPSTELRRSGKCSHTHGITECPASPLLTTARYPASRNSFRQQNNTPEVKPVVGCEFWITDHYDHTLKDDKHRETFHLILLAKNLTGYHNLVKLCSIANCEGVYHGKPRISHKLFVFTRKWLTHRAHQAPFCARGLLKIITVSENAPGAHGNVPRVGRDSTTRQRFHASAEIPRHGKDSTVQQSSTAPRCSAPRPPSTAPAGNLGGTVRAERSLYQSSDEDCLRDL